MRGHEVHHNHTAVEEAQHAVAHHAKRRSRQWGDDQLRLHSRWHRHEVLLHLFLLPTQLLLLLPVPLRLPVLLLLPLLPLPLVLPLIRRRRQVRRPSLHMLFPPLLNPRHPHLLVQVGAQAGQPPH